MQNTFLGTDSKETETVIQHRGTHTETHRHTQIKPDAHRNTETDTGTDLQYNLQPGTDLDSKDRGRIEVMGVRMQRTQSCILSLVK